MKFLVALILCSASVVQAMPYTCESVERTPENGPVMRFKINKKRPVMQDEKVWDMNLIGVTKETGERFIVYGQGQITDTDISMTFVQRSFVIGSANVSSRGEEGILEGEARISGVNGNRYTEVKCVKDTK